MTEVFYAAVKGSLHANDCSVFGLKPEEISALGRRFADSNKPVINGVLIKGTPLDVINSLAELGYRVTASSGETEIVWTLRREALISERPLGKVGSPVASPQATPPLQVSTKPFAEKVGPPVASQATPPLQVSGRPFVVQPTMLRTPAKQVERIGTKPEDWALVEDIRERDRIVPKHISSIEAVEPGQKIILKTNLSSEFNPLSKRPGPNDCIRAFFAFRKRSHSAPPPGRHDHRHHRRRHHRHSHPGRQCGDSDSLDSRGSGFSKRSHRSRGSYGQYCYHVKEIVTPHAPIGSPVHRQGLQIYLEDIIAPNLPASDNKTMGLKWKSPEIFKHVFLPILEKSQGDSSCVYSAKENGRLYGKKGDLCGDAEEFHTGTCKCHRTAPRNGVTDTQQYSVLVSTSDVSVSIGSNHRQRRPGRNENNVNVSRDSECSHLQNWKRNASQTGNYTKSEPCRRLRDSVSHHQDDTRSDYLTTSLMDSDELSADRTSKKYFGKTYVRNQKKKPYPSLSTESSYPDMTLSDRCPSVKSPIPNSSAHTCPHGYHLSELPYVMRTYHVVNRTSEDAQNTSRHGMNESYPTDGHGASERAREPRVRRPEPKISPRCGVTFKDASSPNGSAKQRKTYFHEGDNEPLETLTNSSNMKIARGEIELPKFEELEESDWSLISSLVDDICRSKRTKRKKAVPPCQA